MIKGVCEWVGAGVRGAWRTVYCLCEATMRHCCNRVKSSARAAQNPGTG